MKQKMGDFLMDISQTYPVLKGVNAEKVIEDTRTYLIGKFYNKEIDFDKAKTLLFDEYEKRIFPEPKTLYHYLSQCVINHYFVPEDNGCLVVMKLPQGRIYSFEVTSFGIPLEEIKKDAARRFGNAQISIYPKGSVLIDEEVITP